MALFLEKLKESAEGIEARTRGQRDDVLWYDERRRRITGCHWKGRYYWNLDVIGNHEGNMRDPCQMCVCHNGQIECIATNNCYIRTDCAPVNVPGESCPSFDHWDQDLGNDIFTQKFQSARINKKLPKSHFIAEIEGFSMLQFKPNYENACHHFVPQYKDCQKRFQKLNRLNYLDREMAPEIQTSLRRASPLKDSDNLTIPSFIDATDFLLTASTSWCQY